MEDLPIHPDVKRWMFPDPDWLDLRGGSFIGDRSTSAKSAVIQWERWLDQVENKVKPLLHETDQSPIDLNRYFVFQQAFFAGCKILFNSMWAFHFIPETASQLRVWCEWQQFLIERHAYWDIHYFSDSYQPIDAKLFDVLKSDIDFVIEAVRLGEILNTASADDTNEILLNLFSRFIQNTQPPDQGAQHDYRRLGTPPERIQREACQLLRIVPGQLRPVLPSETPSWENDHARTRHHHSMVRRADSTRTTQRKTHRRANI